MKIPLIGPYQIFVPFCRVDFYLYGVGEIENEPEEGKEENENTHGEAEVIGTLIFTRSVID